MHDLSQWLSDLIADNDLKLILYHEIIDTAYAVYEPTNGDSYRVHVEYDIPSNHFAPKTITIYR